MYSNTVETEGEKVWSVLQGLVLLGNEGLKLWLRLFWWRCRMLSSCVKNVRILRYQHTVYVMATWTRKHSIVHDNCAMFGFEMFYDVVSGSPVFHSLLSAVGQCPPPPPLSVPPPSLSLPPHPRFHFSALSLDLRCLIPRPDTKLSYRSCLRCWQTFLFYCLGKANKGLTCFCVDTRLPNCLIPVLSINCSSLSAVANRIACPVP